MDTRPTPDAPPTLRRLLASVAFCVLLFSLLAYAGEVLKPARTANNVGGQWSAYRTLPDDSVDVMAFGTSHAYTAVDPAELWRARGITSFVLAGPEQRMQVTKYYVREAFHRQHPRVVVLDVVSMLYGESHYNPSYQQMNLNYMPIGLNRLEASVFATPLGHRTEVLVDLWAYHDRWRSVTATDFGLVRKSEGFEYLKGFVPLTVYKKMPTITTSQTLTAEERAAVAYNMPALRDIAEECRRNDAQLLLLLTPTVTPWKSRDVLEQCRADLAKDYPGVRAFDLTAPGVVPGLALDGDYFDPGHVNVRGAEKVGPPLADFLARTYGLADHRPDPRFAWWVKDAEAHDAHIAQKVAATRAFSRNVVTATPEPTATQQQPASGQPTVTPVSGTDSTKP